MAHHILPHSLLSFRVYINGDAFARISGRPPVGVDPTVNVSINGSDLVFLAT